MTLINLDSSAAQISALAITAQEEARLTPVARFLSSLASSDDGTAARINLYITYLRGQGLMEWQIGKHFAELIQAYDKDNITTAMEIAFNQAKLIPEPKPFLWPASQPSNGVSEAAINIPIIKQKFMARKKTATQIKKFKCTDFRDVQNWLREFENKCVADYLNPTQAVYEMWRLEERLQGRATPSIGALMRATNATKIIPWMDLCRIHFVNPDRFNKFYSAPPRRVPGEKPSVPARIADQKRHFSDCPPGKTPRIKGPV